MCSPNNHYTYLIVTKYVVIATYLATVAFDHETPLNRFVYTYHNFGVFSSHQAAELGGPSFWIFFSLSIG
jgi:hypothetical protein